MIYTIIFNYVKLPNYLIFKGERCFLSRERYRKIIGKQVKDLHDLVTVTVQHYPCAGECSHCEKREGGEMFYCTEVRRPAVCRYRAESSDHEALIVPLLIY